MDLPLGASIDHGRTRFAVRAPLAAGVDLCLFENDHESRLAMTRRAGHEGVWYVEVPRDLTGVAYGYRAHGEWNPEADLWFDPSKLLIDPYAVAIDRRFGHSPLLAQHGMDSAELMPRCIVPGVLPEVPLAPPQFTPGGLVYEVNVRGFTLLHPDVPEALRGTVAALAHPAIVAHLQKLHVSAIELMPIVAWIDERHLPPEGLRNFWGYNPVAMMPLDPGLCPGGVAELRETVAALHKAGIGVILDVVLNHTGETDVHGAVLSLRGLDDAAYAKEFDGGLINDTGCGNTLDFAYAPVRALMLASLRHFVRHCGVDGFRFDLAPVLARGPGFDPHAPFFAEIAADPWLRDRVKIAEPWDIGPGGYQLGAFPEDWLEWNDRYRDDVRRFWRGEAGVGVLATRMAGSADVYGEQRCRSVNFLAAHDGFTLADTVSYLHRHNWANGEGNRDGHSENHSWNCGAEGPSHDPVVVARRAEDMRAMLATLFASTGTIMLGAGDEFGRTQQGNNNAYCQDTPVGWVNWHARDTALEDYVADLSARRSAIQRQHPGAFVQFPRAGRWARIDGGEMTGADWESPGCQGFAFASADPERPVHFSVCRMQRRADFY